MTSVKAIITNTRGGVFAAFDFLQLLTFLLLLACSLEEVPLPLAPFPSRLRPSFLAIFGDGPNLCGVH